jgi:ATP-dependent DNA ligase
MTRLASTHGPLMGHDAYASPAGFIQPCLPSPAPNSPAGDRWIHEIKLDGFRMLARRDAAGVRLLTRRGVLPRV